MAVRQIGDRRTIAHSSEAREESREAAIFLGYGGRLDDNFARMSVAHPGSPIYRVKVNRRRGTQ